MSNFAICLALSGLQNRVWATNTNRQKSTRSTTFDQNFQEKGNNFAIGRFS